MFWPSSEPWTRACRLARLGRLRDLLLPMCFQSLLLPSALQCSSSPSPRRLLALASIQTGKHLVWSVLFPEGYLCTRTVPYQAGRRYRVPYFSPYSAIASSTNQRFCSSLTLLLSHTTHNMLPAMPQTYLGMFKKLAPFFQHASAG